MRTRPYHSINFVCNPRICAGRLLVYINIIQMMCARSAEREYPSGQQARVRLARHWFDSWYLHGK